MCCFLVYLHFVDCHNFLLSNPRHSLGFVPPNHRQPSLSIFDKLCDWRWSHLLGKNVKVHSPSRICWQCCGQWCIKPLLRKVYFNFLPRPPQSFGTPGLNEKYMLYPWSTQWYGSWSGHRCSSMVQKPFINKASLTSLSYPLVGLSCMKGSGTIG